MGPIWQAQLGESLVMLIGPSWEPNLLPYWAPNLGPVRETRCWPYNFALTVAKSVFINSGNFRAKSNPPKPISCPLNAHSGNKWGKIPVLTGMLALLRFYRNVLISINYKRIGLATTTNYMVG